VKTKAAGIGIRKFFDMRKKNAVCMLVYGMYGRTLTSERVGDFWCRRADVKVTYNEPLSL